MASDSASVNMLKDAIIAEIASDVLKIKEDIQLISPLVEQLNAGLPEHFDRLRTGMIQTLDEVNKGILEAGGERIDFVKGQLHVFIEQAISKAFSENSEKTEKLFNLLDEKCKAAADALQRKVDDVQGQSEAAGAALNKQVAQFEAQNKAATEALRKQFDSVSEGMSQIMKETGKNQFPSWARVIIPIAFLLITGCSIAVSWGLASYKEAIYMEAFMQKMNSEIQQPKK